jgi:hypothetical protein
MMASIRLFGRGRSAARADGGGALDAERIAAALEGLATASMSTTWRCRHGSGTAIGEGAVDFTSQRSRATVIRGRHAFEYLRIGSTVYRAPVPEDDEPAPDPGPLADPDGEALAQPLDPDEDEDPGDEPGSPEDAELDGDDEDELRSEPGDEGPPGAGAPAGAEDGGEQARAWQTFREHDACGRHAYAEPAVLAAAVRAAGAVTPAGTREIDGRALSGYSVTLKPKPADPDRLLARLARQLRDHGANTIVLTAFVDPDEARAAQDETAETSESAGRDAGSTPAGPRIVRLRLELAHWTPADDPTADHAVTLDLFEFGDPVRIEAPAAPTRRTTRSCADLALF